MLGFDLNTINNHTILNAHIPTKVITVGTIESPGSLTHQNLLQLQ